MRVQFLSVVALSCLSLASPVVDRRADAVSILTDLLATVKTYTSAINATLSPLTPQSSLLDKAAAVTEIGTSFASITEALKSSTDSITALTPGCSNKRSVSIGSTTFEAISEPKTKRQLGITVAVILVLIITEIFATITAAVAILGLGVLLIFLNPLTGGLGALILAVELLVDFLLIDVIIILNTLLTGLALTLGGL